MQISKERSRSRRSKTYALELEWAHTLVRAELAMWTALLGHPSLRRGIAASIPSKWKARGAELTPETVRDLDPDRALLDVILDELSALPPNRELLRQVSELNRTALRARHEIARANTGLVATVAREFDYGILPLADLIQEGHVGLLKAIGRFDPDRGVRFSTYAVWWIRHTVRRALSDKGRLVRLPVNVVNGSYQLRKARRSLTAELGRTPTQDELARATDMTVEQLRRFDRAAAQRSLSIDTPADEDSDHRASRQADVVDTSAGPGDVTETRNSIARMSELLDALSPIESDVLRRRYGLDGREIETLSQIGDDHGLSRERIRQIQQTALTKLRQAF